MNYFVNGLKTFFYHLSAIMFLSFSWMMCLSTQVMEADAALPWQLGLQDPATPVMRGVIHFHHDLMVIFVFVCVFVTFILIRAVQNFHASKSPVSDGVVHGTLIEIIWTMVPAVLLMAIALPSFALLYAVDEVVDPALTLKVVGHQWYWSYEYSDYLSEGDEEAGSIAFDSYMVPEEELSKGDLRLLEVDNRLVLPVDTHIRVVVTSADVLHSWAIPSFAIKMDACPGRLNQVSLFVEREGTYYGQCSEICGVNHGFMPIAVDVVSLEDYLTWVYSKISSEE